MSKWWFSLKHMRVEHGPGDPNSERLGPFDTEAQAANALVNAQKRNDQWDTDDNEWENGTGKQMREEGL